MKKQKIKKKYRPALEALLDYYNGNNQAKFKGKLVRNICPLCITGHCFECPWVARKGIVCIDYAAKKFHDESGGYSPSVFKEDLNGPWVKLRIKQITKWLTKVKK